MANTYGTFTGNGSTDTYAIPFTNWLNDSHVIVRVAGVNYDINSTGTSYDFTVSNGNVVFDANIANGVFFYILRDTLGIDHDDTALLYDFSDGSILTADQQDDVYRQNFYLAQEAAEAVPIYDSGWVNDINGTSIDLGIADTLTISSVKDDFPWGNIEFYARDATFSNLVYPVGKVLETMDNGEELGLAWVYNTTNGEMYITLGADHAVQVGPRTPSTNLLQWGQGISELDQLRIIIYR